MSTRNANHANTEYFPTYPPNATRRNSAASQDSASTAPSVNFNDGHLHASSEATGHDSPAGAHNNTYSANPGDRHLFGLKRPTLYAYSHKEHPSDDYEERFYEDQMFEETGPMARVWRTYLAESATFDGNMVGEARDGLDAMLVFAGLFSAVVITFLVQTSQDIQTDYTQTTASLLTELVALQRALATNASVDTVAQSQLNFTTPSTAPSAIDLWVNALWVVSLSLSLIVALAAVLVKQWLHRYMVLRSGPPGEQSHIRHYRYIGFKKWQVLGIIGSLPVIMHLSLAVFFSGLILFFYQVERKLAYVLASMTCAVYSLYLVTTILPIFYPKCPYQTPLSDFLLVLGSHIRSLFMIPRNLFKCQTISTQEDSVHQVVQLKEREKREVSQVYDTLSVKALHWLYNVSSNPSVHSVVLQALGGLPVAVRHEVRAMFSVSDVRPVYERELRHCTTAQKPKSQYRTREARSGFETVAERLCRSYLIFKPISSTSGWLMDTVTFPTFEKDPKFEFMATSLASSSIHVFPPEHFRAFILSHHNMRLHPLVWMTIIHMAFQLKLKPHNYRRGIHYPSPGLVEPKLFKIILPAIWSATRPRSASKSLPTSTMEGTLYAHMREKFGLFILQEFPQHLHDNERRISSRFSHSQPTGTSAQAFVSLMRYLWRKVCADGANLESPYWDIIDQVLCDYNSDDIATAYLRTALSDIDSFLSSIVQHLIDETSVCSSLSRDRMSSGIRQRRAIILSAYLKTRGKDPSRPGQHWMPSTSGFGSLRRAIEGTLLEIPYLPSVGQPNPSTRAYVVALELLALALRNGYDEAYDIFMRNDCLGLLCRYQVTARHAFNSSDDSPMFRIMVQNFIVGLNPKKVKLEAVARETCIGYLHEPQNLRIAVFALLTGPQSRLYPDVSLASEALNLASLRPGHSSWEDCRLWLSMVLEWATEGRTSEGFFARDLGEEWMYGLVSMYLNDSEMHLRFQEAVRLLTEFFQAENTRMPMSISDFETTSNFGSPIQIVDQGLMLEHTAATTTRSSAPPRKKWYEVPWQDIQFANWDPPVADDPKPHPVISEEYDYV